MTTDEQNALRWVNGDFTWAGGWGERLVSALNSLTDKGLITKCSRGDVHVLTDKGRSALAGKRSMTDQEHAEAIASAAKELNAAIATAMRDRMRVDVEIINNQEISCQHETPIVSVTALRPVLVT